MNTFLKLIGALALAFIIIVTSSIWSGYVLSVLWLWFIVPTFGLTVLSVPLAIGLALVVRFLTYDATALTKEDDRKDREWGAGLILGFVLPALFLFAGWIVHHYV